VALADARQKLANIQVLQGHTDRAAQLLSQAEAFWDHASPQRYAEERLEGMAIKARVQRSAGDLDAAVATETAAISRRIALSGRVHRETAVLYNTHAITLTAANRLDDALAAYRETLDIYKKLGLEAELDAQIILGNMGTLEYRTGHLREAEGLLRNAYQQERALAGDSAAVAAVMGLYGEVLILTGRSAQGLPITREAVDIATRYAGASSPVALQNMLFLSDAQFSTADAQGARATLVADRDAALAQYGPKHPAALRAQMALAHLTYRQGDSAGGRAQLVATIAQVRDLGARAHSTLAQALQYLGEIDLSVGKPVEAAESLREAVAILGRFAASGWNIAVARERLGEALSAGGQPGAAEALNQAVRVLSAELGEEHMETVRAKSALRALDKATPAP
jgi:tetratricopeptide (TPR) repeat protein